MCTIAKHGVEVRRVILHLPLSCDCSPCITVVLGIARLLASPVLEICCPLELTFWQSYQHMVLH